MALPLPIAWFNGAFLPLAEVRVSPLDRGFLFADAVYEVIPVHDGLPFLLEPHLERLERSLRELSLANPHPRTEWQSIVGGLVERNGGGNLAVYLQVTRGADTSRDHAFPSPELRPTVFGMVTPIPAPHPDRKGVRVVTRPDLRWSRCDIKSTALLANILARQAAKEAGAGEALLLRDGELVEGSASSVLIVEGGILCRRPAGTALLPGTTTDAVVAAARAAGIECREERVSEARLRGADEVWITAATRGVVPVTHIDGAPVGDGRPGPVYERVATLFEARLRDERKRQRGQPA